MLALLMMPALLRAQTGDDTRRLALSGRVVDNVTQEPLAGVTVLVVGTRFGAISDARGIYRIYDLPAGTWGVRFSSVGYFW